MYLISSFVCEETRVSERLTAGIAGSAEAQDRYWREMIAQTREIEFKQFCGPFFLHRRFVGGRVRGQVECLCLYLITRGTPPRRRRSS